MISINIVAIIVILITIITIDYYYSTPGGLIKDEELNAGEGQVAPPRGVA